MKTKRGFHFWSGDVNWIDYGGTWIREISPRRYHFIQVTNMDEACGRDNEGHEKYVAELSEVDLDGISAATQRSAWECCDGDCMIGRSETTTIDTAERDRICAGCCFDYGARAPMRSVSTDNAHKGYRECRAESYSLTRDASAYAERMERPVNKLGSTAREYMSGDFTSAVVRGIEIGNTAAGIIGKMYVATDGNTLGGKLPTEDIDAMKAALGKVSP